jgi:hypothetical protein
MNATSPICPTCDSGVHIGRDCDNLGTNTFALRTGVLFPEVGDGPTLENKQEKEISTHYSRDGHDGVKDDSLSFRNSNP